MSFYEYRQLHSRSKSVRDSSGSFRIKEIEDINVYAFQYLMKWKEMLVRVRLTKFPSSVYRGQGLHLFAMVDR